MHVDRVFLADFRNYASITLALDPGLSLVVGANGQGKTNLLEAIYLACNHASYRSWGVEPLIRTGAERALVVLEGGTRSRSLRIEMEISCSGGMKFSINKIPPRAWGAQPSLGCVLFSPEDLKVIKGGPEHRRRFLDDVCVRTRPMAGAEGREFERVLRQRNGILKAAQTRPRALSSLDVWDEQFCRAAAAAVRNRVGLLERLAPAACLHYRELSSGEGVGFTYRPSWVEGAAPTALEEIAESLRRALSRVRSKEVERGASLVGPHRDDLEVTLQGREARLFASQGEQRSLALAMRMAERDLVADERGEDPILLLDDAFSELDDRRRGRLREMVASSGQAIVTSTSLSGVSLTGRVLEVVGGRILGRP
ncbi:MAG: DNA replication/repair protein RecF [Actinomycetota bacterium]